MNIKSEKNIGRLIEEAYRLGQNEASLQWLNPSLFIQQTIDTDNKNLSNKEIEKQRVELLKKLFRFSLENNHWGRFLFYIIKGGTKVDTRVNIETWETVEVSLSPLPRLLYPRFCIVPTCDDASPLRDHKDNESFLDWARDGHISSFYHSQCKDKWIDQYRSPLNKAIDAAFGCFPKNEEVSQPISILLKGYEALMPFLNGKEYHPEAFFLAIFQDNLTIEELSRICLMPSDFSGGYSHMACFQPIKSLKNIHDYKMATEPPVSLPIEAFDKTELEVEASENFKKVSVFYEDLIPADEQSENASSKCILLKELGRYLNSDLA